MILEIVYVAHGWVNKCYFVVVNYSQLSISQRQSISKATDISKQIFWPQVIYFEILLV